MAKDELWILSTEVPPHTCPACHRVNDAVTLVSNEPMDRGPMAGDVSICAYCHVVSIFQANGRLRLATSRECGELPEWAIIHMADRTKQQRRN